MLADVIGRCDDKMFGKPKHLEAVPADDQQLPMLEQLGGPSSYGRTVVMALSDITSRQAVLDAIAEFNRLKRDEFLSLHGFRKARRYFLDRDGDLYDSKAIVGVAHGYQFPREGTLKAKDFSGGDRTVRRKLEELGFTVRVVGGNLA